MPRSKPSKTSLNKKIKEFFAIKLVLIVLVLTLVTSVIGSFGLSIFPTGGWVKVTENQPYGPYDPLTRTSPLCTLAGKVIPPFGFPSHYFIGTNMEKFVPPNTIFFPIWRIGTCDIPLFVNPFAFLVNMIFFLALIHLYRRWRS